MQSVFKIDRVLSGDSRAVAIEGRDARARLVRLELPADEAASIRPGAVLVVQWWAAELPAEASLLDGADAADSTGAVETTPTSDASTGAEAARSEAGRDESIAGASDADRVEAEFRRLMGLR